MGTLSASNIETVTHSIRYAIQDKATELYKTIDRDIVSALLCYNSHIGSYFPRSMVSHNGSYYPQVYALSPLHLLPLDTYYANNKLHPQARNNLHNTFAKLINVTSSTVSVNLTKFIDPSIMDALKYLYQLYEVQSYLNDTSMFHKLDYYQLNHLLNLGAFIGRHKGITEAIPAYQRRTEPDKSLDQIKIFRYLQRIYDAKIRALYEELFTHIITDIEASIEHLRHPVARELLGDDLIDVYSFQLLRKSTLYGASNEGILGRCSTPIRISEKEDEGEFSAADIVFRPTKHTVRAFINANKVMYSCYELSFSDKYPASEERKEYLMGFMERINNVAHEAAMRRAQLFGAATIDAALTAASITDSEIEGIVYAHDIPQPPSAYTTFLTTYVLTAHATSI